MHIPRKHRLKVIFTFQVKNYEPEKELENIFQNNARMYESSKKSNKVEFKKLFLIIKLPRVITYL